MQRYLFDRITQPLAHIPDDEHGRLVWLHRSITDELQRLFSQRSFFAGLDKQQYSSGHAPTVLDFGLHDIVSKAANLDSTHQVAEQIKRLILHYEPRLHQPQIELVTSKDPTIPATLRISGMIKTESLQDEFSWQSIFSGTFESTSGVAS